MFILGSSSPRRQKLISFLLKDYQILTADLDEASFVPLARSPQELVTKLALAKANKIIKVHSLENDIILAADTVISFSPSQNYPNSLDWQILGKPKDLEDAKKNLAKLRAQKHQVLTGLVVIDQKTNQTFSDCVITNVIFKDFSDQLVNNYVDTYKPFDKAGSYALQEMSSDYCEKIEGDYSNIIGLPLDNIADILTELNLDFNHDYASIFQKEFPIPTQK